MRRIRSARGRGRAAGRRVHGTFLLVLLATSAALRAVPAGAEPNQRAGTSVFQFLKIGVGARAMGMGGAFTAVADDPHAAYWNPAGLGLPRFPEGSATYMSYFSGVDAGSAAFVQPVGAAGGIALLASFLRVGGLQTTTTQDRTGEGYGTFSASDLALTAAVGGRVRTRLHAGLAVSFVYEGISALGGFSTTASAFTLGLLYRTGLESLTAGVAVRHLGNQLALYQADVEDLPLTVAAGLSTRPFTRRLLLAVDAEKPRDDDLGVNAGAEFQLVRDFFVRAGYRSLDRRVEEGATNGDFAGLTFGLGVVATRTTKVDYAYASFADLGDVHRISASYVFR